MGVRSARPTDLFAIHMLDKDPAARVLSPALSARESSAVAATLYSGWRGVGRRHLSLVLRRGSLATGFAQAHARPGRESWDITRLSCLAANQEEWERSCLDLVDRICAASAQRGALRTFARSPVESERLGLLAASGFRQYANEVTLAGTLRSLVDGAGAPSLDLRPRLARDAWDIFSLYCAVTPALVRHAEGRSLKEWMPSGPAFPTPRMRRLAVREVVVAEVGQMHAWIRWSPAHQQQPQLLEVLVRPDATARLAEVLRYATDELGLDRDCLTLCRTREYDGRVSATLEEAGFGVILREMLLVRHTIARVTERQLLVAALRAQGLGIDVSQYRRGSEPMHQRLASSREAEQHYYDRIDRTCDYRRPSGPDGGRPAQSRGGGEPDGRSGRHARDRDGPGARSVRPVS